MHRRRAARRFRDAAPAPAHYDVGVGRRLGVVTVLLALASLAHCGSFSSAPAAPQGADAAISEDASSDAAPADAGPCQVLYATSFDAAETFDVQKAGNSTFATDGKLVATATDGPGRTSAYFVKPLDLAAGTRTVTVSYSIEVTAGKGGSVLGCGLTLRASGGGAAYKLYYEEPKLYADLDLADGGPGPAPAALGTVAGAVAGSVMVKLSLSPDGVYAESTVGPFGKVSVGPLPTEAPSSLLLECGIVRFSSTTNGAKLTVEMDDLRVEACR